MSDLRLISFKLCPFVQRSVITLHEKGEPFGLDYIDLSNKPDWFLEISPLGKVPVLQTGDATLFESAVINEYIDDVVGERVMPADPLERAQHRMWIEFASALIGDMWRAQSTPDDAVYEQALAGVKSKSKQLEAVIAGPLFFGETFSLVDAAIAPALQRIAWSAEMDDRFDVFADSPKLALMRQTLEARESVQKSLVPEIRTLFVELIRNLGGVLSKSA